MLLRGKLERKTPVVLTIIDGFGVGKPDPATNPIYATPMPFYSSTTSAATSAHLYRTLAASGSAVGLPDGDQGNSEVGHNAMGAGRVYDQGSKLVQRALASPDFWNPDKAPYKLVAPALSHTIHLMGLLSDGAVHSRIADLHLLIDGLVGAGARRLRIHCLLDGRDVGPATGLDYISELETHLARLRAAGVDAEIASLGGRMHTVMDRYNSDWAIVRRGWRQVVWGVVEDEDITADYPGYFPSAKEAVECARRVFPEKLDQFNPCAVIVGEDGKPVGAVHDNDLVINWNFRGDRAIQISRAFDEPDFSDFDRSSPHDHAHPPKVLYAGLMSYDSDHNVPHSFLISPPQFEHVLSDYLCELGINSYAVSETHKFGHVTYFWNGNYSGYKCKKHEMFECISSDPVAELVHKPRMHMPEIAAAVAAQVASGSWQFLRSNLPGPDMVGHTGSFEATQESLRCVDACLMEIDKAVKAANGVHIVVSDHGNAESMAKDGSSTSHTTAEVPFFISEYDPAWQNTYVMNEQSGLGISSVAPTLLTLMGFLPPVEYVPSAISVK